MTLRICPIGAGSIALSTILSGLIKYWGPVLTIYLTTVTLLLVPSNRESDRKNQAALRTSTPLRTENPAN